MIDQNTASVQCYESRSSYIHTVFGREKTREKGNQSNSRFYVVQHLKDRQQWTNERPIRTRQKGDSKKFEWLKSQLVWDSRVPKRSSGKLFGQVVVGFLSVNCVQRRTKEA